MFHPRPSFHDAGPLSPRRTTGPASRRRGFATMIGLLLVVAIILVLVDTGYFRRGPDGKTAAKTYVDKSRNSACVANLAVLRGEIQSFTMQNNGEVPPANMLRAKLSSARCPDGGRYQVDSQGNVYCTTHAPAPDALAASVKNLQ